MKRTTIMLPERLKTRAEREARRRGISLGELVRVSLQATTGGGGAGDDPLFADKAVFSGESPADLAVDHDRYLYGADE